MFENNLAKKTVTVHGSQTSKVDEGLIADNLSFELHLCQHIHASLLWQRYVRKFFSNGKHLKIKDAPESECSKVEEIRFCVLLASRHV